jgi:hypothetical protein
MQATELKRAEPVQVAAALRRTTPARRFGALREKPVGSRQQCNRRPFLPKTAVNTSTL